MIDFKPDGIPESANPPEKGGVRIATSVPIQLNSVLDRKSVV